MDIFVLLILAFVVVIILVLFKFASSTINTEMLAQADAMQEHMSNNTNVTQILGDTITEMDAAFDHFRWIAIFFIFGYVLSIFVSAFLVRTHPAFFIAYVMMQIIALVVAVYLSNTYETLSANGTLQSTFLSFGGAHFIMLNLPIWSVVVGFLAGILMYMSLDWGVYYR